MKTILLIVFYTASAIENMIEDLKIQQKAELDKHCIPV